MATSWPAKSQWEPERKVEQLKTPGSLGSKGLSYFIDFKPRVYAPRLFVLPFWPRMAKTQRNFFSAANACPLNEEQKCTYDRKLQLPRLPGVTKRDTLGGEQKIESEPDPTPLYRLPRVKP